MTVNKPQIDIELYSNGWIAGQTQNLPDAETAQAIAELFTQNYPTMYDPETRAFDLARYETGAQILKQIQNCNTWVIARINGVLVGIHKFREENRSGNPDNIEILSTWTMVDKNFRGLGIAEEMIIFGLNAVSEIKKNTQKRVFSIGDVHINNTASRHMLSKTGHIEEQEVRCGFIGVRKEL